MESQLMFLILCSTLIGVVFSYPTQVPEGPQVCRTMTPGHGASPQSSASPYKVEASPKIVRQGDVVQVLLSGTQSFQGFYLQGRDINGQPVGTFTPAQGQKTHNCGNGKNNAIFHGVRGQKNNIEIYWKSPKDFTGPITFTATFVKDFDTIWTNVKANPVTVKA